MTTEIDQIEKFTVDEFQSNFDSLMNRVENGETFMICSEHGNALIVPYNEVIEVFEDYGVDEELIHIHTCHEEGS